MGGKKSKIEKSLLEDIGERLEMSGTVRVLSQMFVKLTRTATGDRTRWTLPVFHAILMGMRVDIVVECLGAAATYFPNRTKTFTSRTSILFLLQLFFSYFIR